MPNIKELLEVKGVLIGDGAMGTMLMSAGLAAGNAPESWNVDKPEQVERVHAAYLAAGSDWILTNTFGGSPDKLAGYGLEAKCEEYNRAAAELARRAAGESGLVLGNIGPTGRLMAPLGDADPDQVEDGFKRQASALAEGGANGFAIETMADATELKAALRACVPLGLPVIASMSFNKSDNGYATMMGVTTLQAAGIAESEGAWACGMNCQLSAEEMLGAVAEFKAASSLVIFAEPNAGSPELVDGETVFRQGPEDMAAGIDGIRSSGAGIIGACCGSTPEHIRAIAEQLKG
jgi:5-methyltetrahydrofolate--homocysteine methyltransferase